MITKRVKGFMFVYCLKSGIEQTVFFFRMLFFGKANVDCMNKAFVFKILYCNFVTTWRNIS